MKIDELNSLTQRIIGAAIEVHKQLGPGLLESVYEACLVEELKSRGLSVESQVDLPVIYKGKVLDKKFRIDVLVENEVIIELKTVEMLQPIHEVQLLTYLKLAGKRIGLLMNFNETQLLRGLKRKINGY